MKRPSIAAYAVGNPISALALAIVCLIGMVQAVRGEYAPIIGWGSLGLLVGIIPAADRVEKYGAWKAEWDAMNGVSPNRFRWPRIPYLRPILAGLLWLGAADYIAHVQTEPANANLAGWFWIVSFGVGVFLFVRWRMRRPARVGGRGKKRYPDVAILLARPARSPTPAEARAALPGYCQRLLAR